MVPHLTKAWKYPDEDKLWGHKGVAVEDGIYEVCEPFDFKVIFTCGDYPDDCYGVSFIMSVPKYKTLSDLQGKFGKVLYFVKTSKNWQRLNDFVTTLDRDKYYMVASMHRDLDIEMRDTVGWIE